MDLSLGLGLTAWIFITLILVALGWFVNMGLNGQQKKAVKVVAVGALIITTMVGGLWATDETSTPTGNISGVIFDTEGASAGAHVIQMSDYSFKILCVYDISDGALAAATDDATFTFVNTRADTEIIDATAICKITDYGSKTNVTTDQTYNGLAKNADGSFNVVFSSSQSVNTTNQIVVPYDKTLSADTFTVIMTPNVNAIAASVLQDGVIVTMVNAGQTYTFEFVHSATQA